VVGRKAIRPADIATTVISEKATLLVIMFPPHENVRQTSVCRGFLNAARDKGSDKLKFVGHPAPRFHCS
jgi:hypothetical protein